MKKRIRLLFGIEFHELPFVFNMFSYFFLVITTFWLLKPLKKTLFFQFYKAQGGFMLFGDPMTAAQAELLAKILNMVAAMAAVVVFSWLSEKFKREKLTWVLVGFFIACFVIYGFTLKPLTGFSVWTFYVFGDMFATVMVATFFAFLNDSVSPDIAKRLYGPIGLGGLVGGACGSTIEALFVNHLSLLSWMLICCALCGIMMMNAHFARLNAEKLSGKSYRPIVAPVMELKKSNSAVDGAKMVFGSPYLISIAAIVCLYEIISALVDFQFSATFEHSYSSHELATRFGQVFARNNWVALSVQVILTGFVMRRFGLVPALLALPAAEITGALGFIVFPVPFMAGMLSTIDNGFSYSINQSAKEALYVPTAPRDVKYKAKAFIDMFVQRFGKAAAVPISLIITVVFKDYSTIRWISLMTCAIALIWSGFAWYAGQTFDRSARTNNHEEPVVKTLLQEAPASA
jgi:ATP:ADP antiporter, AAA family